MKRRVVVSCVVAVLLSLAFALPGFSFQWTVTMPATGLPFDKCFIDSKNGVVELYPGNTYSFSDTVASGRCHPVGATYPVRLKNRTCDHKDWESSISVAKCSQDITIRICAKVANPSIYPDYHYGFCE